MNREYHKWWSNHLRRDMELLVFGHAGPKAIVFPTRGNRFFEYENMRMTEVLRPKLESGALQLVCVDGIDGESFYCWWAHPSGRIQRHIQFENYVIREVVPFINRRNPHPTLMAHGCSLGAFVAANIAFRYPNIFNHVAAFSGRYDLTFAIESFKNLFDGYYDDHIYYNTPTHYLPNIECDNLLTQLRKMNLLFVIGEEDPFKPNNQELSRILQYKGISHDLQVWRERAHQGYHWRRMAAEYF